MGAIWAMAIKDLRLLARDKGAAFFTFVFPLMIALFFGVIFGGDGPKAKLAVIAVNEDGGPAATSFIDDLVKDDALRVATSVGKAPDVHAPTRAEGEALVRHGEFIACIIVPKGFEDADMFSGGGLKIEASVDPSHNAEAGLLTGKLNEIGFRQMAKTFSDPSRMAKTLDRARASVNDSNGLSSAQKATLNTLFGSLDSFSKSGLKVNEDSSSDAAGNGGGFMPVRVDVHELKADDRPGPRNSFEVSFPQGVVWGLMGCVTAFGASMASERSRGTLMRLYVAPITRSHVLLGKALACFLACVMVQVMLLIVGSLPMLKVHVGNWPLMAVAVLMSAFGFTGVMMIMSGFTRTEGSASGLGRGLIIMLAMIGGGTIPLMFMPEFMTTVSSFSPFKWAILSFEGALWRGYSPAQMLWPAGVLAGVGVLGFTVGALAMHRAETV